MRKAIQEILSDDSLPAIERISHAMTAMNYTDVDGVYISNTHLSTEYAAGFRFSGKTDDPNILIMALWKGEEETGYHFEIEVDKATGLLFMLDEFIENLNDEWVTCWIEDL